MRKLLIPRKDVKVRDPKTGFHIPPEGAVRMVDSYFDRRIKDGDLEVRDAPVEKKPGKKPSSKNTESNGDK